MDGKPTIKARMDHPDSDDTLYEDASEAPEDLDHTTLDLAKLRKDHSPRTLTSLVNHSNVIMIFLPFAHAVLTFAHEMVPRRMRYWKVNKRF